MTVLGFSFAKQQIRSTVLDGTKSHPIFLSKEKRDYGAGYTPTEISIWLNRNIIETINHIKPNLVCYRLSWSYTKKEQAYSLIFPCAIVELVCSELGIACKGFGHQALTNKSLGFPKGIDLYNHCTTLIGSHPPYWDKHQINSALVAIVGMEN